MKHTKGKCIAKPSWHMKKDMNNITGYRPIVGENYKFQYIGGISYRVHGLWMAEMSYAGRPTNTFLVLQKQNIKPFFEVALQPTKQN